MRDRLTRVGDFRFHQPLVLVMMDPELDKMYE